MTWLEPLDPHTPRRVAQTLHDRAEEAREDLMDQVTSLSRHVRDMLEPRLKETRDLVRREAPIIADAALRQATRMARRAKADPIPIVVGVVGLALLASLISGRRRRT